MSGELRLISRQRPRTVDLNRLRRMIRYLLRDLLDSPDFDLTVQLFNSLHMARLNQIYLGHECPTDVITFDYSDGPASPLVGEIFICVDEAIIQARRFRTTWQSELARYVIHGALHLRGHDDRQPLKRRRMKREEGRLLKELSRRFDLSKLERARRITA
jgi:probable rRNA maturation factor